MSNLLLMGVGNPKIPLTTSATSSSATPEPAFQFFENFPGHLGVAFRNQSNGIISVNAVNIPLSIEFNNVVMLMNRSASLSAGSLRHILQFGLYSMNGGTLSLANSAGTTLSIHSSDAPASFNSWISLATSATQNITPGQWYFASNIVTQSTNHGVSFLGNSSYAPANANLGAFHMGRMTVSTAAMPASIATSVFDITGTDAIRQFYCIITA